MSAGTSVGELRERIASRLGEPNRLQFPSGWATSTSWRRAQAAPSTIGSVNPGEFDVLLGRGSGKNAPSRHRVLFAVYEGDLVAECDCDGYHFRDWCAHVALLWWKWSREQLGVTDLDTGETHCSPPWWFSVDDVETDRADTDLSQPVAADGGVER